MSTTPLARRPLSCLKASLRRARQHRIISRHMATEAAQTTASPRPLLGHNFFPLTDRKTKTLRSAFAVYPSTTVAGKKALTPPPVNVLQSLHEAQIKKMDPTGARTALFAKTREAAKVGDVLMVTHRRGGEPFAGVCLSIRRRGIDTAILLRNHLGKVGVEMWFKIYNKNVAGIEIVKRRPKRARRARLTYMRKPKHDMGSVEDLVFAWKRSRKVFSSGKPAAAATAAKGAKGAKGTAGAKKK
ncbi:hypothetical protein N657DRAFT_618492 [Parathielavia appendiculata]|uniref:Ribosomal protein L19 n=1 Tax=Parathielavia appendiculata TaxID=2587402 RepID=A0AAN6U1K9_9PEZI|nr:hypothetical protein N657DRAFT_618492 [Parathielavia appendiculata]